MHAGHAPGERVVADVDARDLALGRERQDLLAVVGRVHLVRIDHDRHRVEGQRGVGEDGADGVPWGSMT